MGEMTQSAPTREDWRQRRTIAIKNFISEFASSEDEDLLTQMMITICRLGSDKADRGDLKILNTAMRELRYAFKVFRPYAEVPKVSIFGSARTPEDHPQYFQARKFAQLIHEQGWMAITGAGDGIMRAGNHGATRRASFGVSISLPFEQSTNTIIANDHKLVNFKYFFTRKLVFVKEAKAIVLFPGGFGTQDEGFESLTLIQTLKASPTPVVMCDQPGGTYWKNWMAYVKKELLDHGMIDPLDLELFYITDRAENAVNEILKFYSRYHSSRFVGDQFVFRLNKPLSEKSLTEINSNYSDLLVDGVFEQMAEPLKGEDNEYPDKSRLVFKFHRQNAGKLRLLINSINEAS